MAESGPTAEPNSTRPSPSSRAPMRCRSTPRARSPRSSPRSRSTISASTISSAQRPDRRRHHRGRQAGGQAALRRRPAGHGRRPAEGPDLGRRVDIARYNPDVARPGVSPGHAISPTHRRRRRPMPIVQSIDSALEKTVGKHGVSDQALTTRWPAPRPRSRSCARGTPTARCRCCACRRRMTICARSATPPASRRKRHRHRHPRHRRLVASAARRWRNSPAMACPASARCASRRACISWTISIPTPSRPARSGCRIRPRASSRSRNRAAPPRR